MFKRLFPAPAFAFIHELNKQNALDIDCEGVCLMTLMVCLYVEFAD